MTQAYPLRQQLSAANLSKLLVLAKTEAERLNRLKLEVLGLGGKEGLDAAIMINQGIDAEVAQIENAMTQLSAVYCDQFAGGRAENDSYGRTGLVIKKIA